MSMYERLCMVLMSAPATKALSPLPVMTMARISGSASNSSAHAVSSLTKLARISGSDTAALVWRRGAARDGGGARQRARGR